MSDPSCRRCGALVVDLARHEEWHQYHQQQLVRLVHQIDRQQKVTGGLAVRFSSFVNNKAGGNDDDGAGGITVDLLAFATYWIGAGMAIGVLAWSVSERRWLPAGGMLLFALGAMYLAYREIRPANRSGSATSNDFDGHTDQRYAPAEQQPAFTPTQPSPPPTNAPQPAQQTYQQPTAQPSPYPMASYSSGNGQVPPHLPNGNAPGNDRDPWR